MGPRSRTLPRLLVGLLSLALFVLAVSSCASGGALQQPALAWVKADRQTYDAIAPKFAAYVADDNLASPDLKQAYATLLDDWLLRVEEGEKLYGLTSAAPPMPMPGIMVRRGLCTPRAPPPIDDGCATVWAVMYYDQWAPLQ